MRSGKKTAKPAPKVEQKPEQNLTPIVESTCERGSIAWFDDEISRRDAALIKYEDHIRFLDTESAQEDAVNLDTLKKRKAASGYANDLRQEIARIRIEKANAETAVKKDDKSAAQITKERIAALKGKR